MGTGKGREETGVQRRAGIVVSNFAEHLRNENCEKIF